MVMIESDKRVRRESPFLYQSNGSKKDLSVRPSVCIYLYVFRLDGLSFLPSVSRLRPFSPTRAAADKLNAANSCPRQCK